MGSFKLLLALILVGVCCQIERAQSTYSLGTPPSAEELRIANIYEISPTGEGLPPGSGDATQGAQVYAAKCAVCHADNGAGLIGPPLIKGAQPNPVPCLSPCIRGDNVIGFRAEYAPVIWDYINRGMPFGQEGSLKPDEVYALTAFLLYKNGVIPEAKALDAQSLPQIQMPNRDGFVIPPLIQPGQKLGPYRSTKVQNKK